MRETIGLLGGSFNPIHLGHLAMAEAALGELALSRLIIMPDGDPPHKSKELAGKRHRLRMAELAAAGRFEVSAMEVNRPGKTYTVDTLEVLRTLYPQARLVMLIGADTLRELPGWKSAARVFQLCDFAVFARDDLPLVPPPGVTAIKMRAAIPDISATEIRFRVHCGQALEGFVPQAVEDYIGRHRLYDPPQRMSRKAIDKRLRAMLPPGRYQHSLGVEQTARRLAERWHYDAEKAALTGLVHDSAKGMTLETMIKYVHAQGVRVDPQRKESVALLHAYAGAAIARQVFGITDPDILHAVRWHNTGCARMGALDMILYLADAIEPGRKDTAPLAALRALAMEDLEAATAEAMRICLAHITGKGRGVHPDTAAALAAMEKRIDERKGNA